MNAPDKNLKDLKILFSEEDIQKRLKELASDIEKIFPENETLYIICVLKGSVMFSCDLAKRINRNIKLEFVRVSSYGNDMKSSRKIISENFNLPDLTGQNLLIAEDIVDSGLTSQFLISEFKNKYKVKKLIFAALLNKKCARKIPIEPDLFGFEIDDKFAAGYGLDYKEFFRNLPYIGYF